MNRQHELAALVIATNRGHAYANGLYEALRPIFEPLVGTVVCKQDGSLLAKVEKLVPKLPYETGLSVLRDHTNYSLRWSIKTSETIDGLAYYRETTVTIGEKDGLLLSKICPAPVYRADYTLQEILAKRSAVAMAKKVYEDACDECYPFKPE